MLFMATVLHLGKSSLPKKPITDDDVDRISLCLKVLSECSPLMNDIFNKECRRSLSHMLAVRLEEEKLSQKVNMSSHCFLLITELRNIMLYRWTCCWIMYYRLKDHHL